MEVIYMVICILDREVISKHKWSLEAHLRQIMMLNANWNLAQLLIADGLLVPFELCFYLCMYSTLGQVCHWHQVSRLCQASWISKEKIEKSPIACTNNRNQLWTATLFMMKVLEKAKKYINIFPFVFSARWLGIKRIKTNNSSLIFKKKKNRCFLQELNALSCSVAQKCICFISLRSRACIC